MMRRIAALLSLCLCLVTPASAALDFNGSTDKLDVAAVIIGAAPITVCAWAKPDNTTANHGVWSVSDSASTTIHFVLDMVNTGDFVRWYAAISGSATAQVDTFTTAWQHVCGRETSATSRHAFLNGTASAEETTSKVPNSLDTSAIGVRKRSTEDLFFDGHIAEIATWNRALSNAEIAALAAGYSPHCFQRGLVSYLPMLTSAQDLTGISWTVSGTAAGAHPRIIYCH